MRTPPLVHTHAQHTRKRLHLHHTRTDNIDIVLSVDRDAAIYILSAGFISQGCGAPKPQRPSDDENGTTLIIAEIKEAACEDAAVDKLTKGAVDDLIDEAWAASLGAPASKALFDEARSACEACEIPSTYRHLP